jgi:hypothetical protein
VRDADGIQYGSLFGRIARPADCLIIIVAVLSSMVLDMVQQLKYTRLMTSRWSIKVEVRESQVAAHSHFVSVGMSLGSNHTRYLRPKS